MAYDDNWQQRARCRNEDPNRMQPESATPDELEQALSVCNSCPVRRECRELAQSQGSGAYGVHDGEWWGDPPEDPTVTPCAWCAEPTPGPQARYCSTRCRVRAHRAREAACA